MFSTSPSSSYEHSNRVAAARSLAAAAALATVGNNGNGGSGASPAVVYRLIEQADRKNKVMSADPKRTLFRTLLQRRHFQILRDAAAQVERSHQAELLREQQRLQEQIFNLRFQQTGHAGHMMNQTPTTQTVKSTPVAAGGPIAIARPAHFNAALLRNKDSQGWPSNQWTAAAAAASAVAAPAPVPAPVEEYHESSFEDVTFESEESNVSSVSAFEQEWMEVTSCTSSSPLPVGTAPMCTVTISTATSTTTTPSTPLSTGSSSSCFFGLPCGTAGLSVGTHQSEVNQEVVVSSSSPSSPSSPSSKHSRVVAAPTPRSEGRGWGNGSGKRGACSSSFVGGSAKKIREDDEEEEEKEVEQEKREVRIGFASSPFQWQSLFDQSQLQQVLCN